MTTEKKIHHPKFGKIFWDSVKCVWLYTLRLINFLFTTMFDVQESNVKGCERLLITLE